MTGQGNAERTLTDQEAFDLLSSRRRRLAFRCLADVDGAASLGTLAREVAAVENGVDIDQVTRRQRKRVYTALRQSHLPRMADTGVVEYDPDRGEVELTPLSDSLCPYLDGDDGAPDWATLYLGLAGVVLLGLLASVAGLPPFDALPWTAWVLAFVVGTAALAAAHRSSTRDVGGLHGGAGN